MKHWYFRLTLFTLVILAFFLTGNFDKDQKEIPQKIRRGTAIVITGAAAKIAQEAALLEELDRKGMLKDVVFISGASSGALNAVALNGVLSGKFSWHEYVKILEQVTNDDVFIKNGSKVPVNTQPLRELITKIACNKLGYAKLSDLPYTTAFSVVDLKFIPFEDRTFRICNKKINTESDSSLNIVDVLMASTAIPLVFPAQRISNIKTLPNDLFHDGGIAADHVPFYAVVQYQKYCGFDVEKMIIISRKRDSLPKLYDELQQIGVDKLRFFDKINVSPEALSNKGFLRRLKDLNEKYPNLAQRTYIYVPTISEEFLMFDFNNLKKQYEITSNWAKNHDPVPLHKFLENYKE